MELMKSYLGGAADEKLLRWGPMKSYLGGSAGLPSGQGSTGRVQLAGLPASCVKGVACYCAGRAGGETGWDVGWACWDGGDKACAETDVTTKTGGAARGVVACCGCGCCGDATLGGCAACC